MIPNMTRVNDVFYHIKNNPGCTNADISKKCGFSVTYAGILTKFLVDKNMATRKGVKKGTAWIYHFYPMEDATQPIAPALVKTSTSISDPAPASKKEKKTLDDYNPRELMISLSKRGWKGKMSYTKEKQINFEDITLDDLQRLKDEGFVGSFTLTKVYEIEIN